MNLILAVVRRQALTYLDFYLRTRQRCTTPVQRNDERRIPDRSIWVWSIVRLRHGYSGIFPRTTRRWREENWIRRPKGEVCRQVFSTTIESRVSYPINKIKWKYLKVFCIESCDNINFI